MEYSNIYPRNKKILLVGSYPPPLGGISVHIYRLYHNLKKDDYEVDIFDTSKGSKIKGEFALKLLIHLTKNKTEILHLHLTSNKYFITILLLHKVFKFELFFTIHNSRFFYQQSAIAKFIRKQFIAQLDFLIVVGNHILEELKLINISMPERVIVKNAFIPPILDDEEKIRQSYPPELKSFLSEHSPILLSNAYKLVFHNNIDLYGIDMCIELTKKLKNNFPRVGFLFALANANIKGEYFQYLQNKISELKIEDNFLFMLDQKEIWPLFKIINLNIRATVTDGDAISIREALFFNCPVLASDVVKRPEQCQLFKNRDINDLYYKCLKIMGN